MYHPCFMSDQLAERRESAAPPLHGAEGARPMQMLYASTEDITAVDTEELVATATMTMGTPAEQASVVSSRTEPAPLLARGETLAGRYEIGERLGFGGMGQVYEALDLERGKVVAIKICHAEVDAGVLETEAAALAAIDHPGVVRAYETGVHEGQTFLVMEHLQGITLRTSLQQRWMKAGPDKTRLFSVSEALSILARIADALAAIHESGFVHRDLKPSNIMLTSDGHPVLFDLGVSFRSEDATAEDRMAGSPHYIAPEAIEGCIAEEQAERVDIYALGVIAFELLSGRRPFEYCEGERLLRRQLDGDMPPLRRRRGEVPAELNRLVSDMTARDPAERPSSARALAARLRALQGSPERCLEPAGRRLRTVGSGPGIAICG